LQEKIQGDSIAWQYLNLNLIFLEIVDRTYI
jgi:hypothetical protein